MGSSFGGEIQFHQLASRPGYGGASECLPEGMVEITIHVFDSLADAKHLER
jgi:hypothetical protein